MNFFKKLWTLLDGKKRNIAIIYWSVLVPSMAIIWPEGFNSPSSIVFYKITTILGIFLSALGLGHAYVKSQIPDDTEETKTEIEQK
jgi:hypothetical protein